MYMYRCTDGYGTYIKKLLICTGLTPMNVKVLLVKWRTSVMVPNFRTVEAGGSDIHVQYFISLKS